jgi:hypothetical protein
MAAQIRQLLAMDALFKNFYLWLAGQFDSQSGGFYYARSSIGHKEYQADIESTAQALHIMAASGLLTPMPEPIKKGLIIFFQRRQQPGSGYFYDPHNDMRTVDRMVGRAVNYSVSSLRILGSIPFYPIPGAGGAGTLPPYMRDLDTYRKWMKERNWSNAWMACDNISATTVFLEHLPEKEQREYLNAVLEFLTAKQDPQTGMWGEGRPYIKISGVFKLILLYRRFNILLPRPEEILASLFETLRTDTSEDMCWTRNSIEVLAALQYQISDISQDDILECFDITLKNLERYLKADGGFSRHVETSLESPNEMPLGLGLAEGDMNAGTQALRIRNLCYAIAGKNAEPLKEYIGDFYEKIGKNYETTWH